MVYKKGFDRLLRAAALMDESEQQMANGKSQIALRAANGWQPIVISRQPLAIGRTSTW